MAQFDRTKKLTSYVYSPTDPASEDAIRLQVDNSIQEVADILYSQDVGKGASQVGINGLAYATVQDLAQVVSDSGTGTAPPSGSVGNDQLATDVKVGSLELSTTTDKSSVIAVTNEITENISDLKNQVLDNTKAVSELLMIADIDSKVFSDNLNKFYTNFTATMGYSMGDIDFTKQSYVGTLNSGASSVVVTSSTGFFAGQEVSIQTATTYEDIILLSVVGNTLNFKTATTLTHVNPDIYRSNILTTTFGPIGSYPTQTTLAMTFDSTLVPEVGPSIASNTGTYDTVNKVFGVASMAYLATSFQFTNWADNAAFEFGSGNFFLDFRVRKAALGYGQFVMGKCGTVNDVGNTNFVVELSSANTIVLYASNGSTLVASSSPAITDTNFHHVRVGRNGNNLICAVDGIIGTPVAFTGSITDSAFGFSIGRAGAINGSYFSGNVDNLVIVKGVAMNNANFTVPTVAKGTAILKTAIRMNITPYEPIKNFAGWLTKSELAGFTSDSYLSIVGPSADESYIALTESATDLGSTEEVEMLGKVVTPNTKATLKIILNRSSTGDAVIFTKLLGGVSA